MVSSTLGDALLAVIPYYPLLVAYLGYVALYSGISPLLSKSEKHRSWILTGIAAAGMTIGSLPFVWAYVCTLANVGDGWGSSVGNVGKNWPHLADTIVRAFQAYLVADLTMGSLFYRSQLTVATGWLHHTLYIFIVELAIGRGWSHIFCLAAIMEFPTLVLAISTLFPRLRSNLFFAVSFFTTRILFHGVLAISFAIPANRPIDALSGKQSPIPAMILAGILPLHLMWFRGCINGFIKRAKARRLAVAAASSPENSLRILVFRPRRVALQMYISRTLRGLPSRMDVSLRHIRAVRPALRRSISDPWGTMQDLRLNNPLRNRVGDPRRTLQQLDRPLSRPEMATSSGISVR